MANDLLKEAIADAKAVRETALANAKIALEEAFTPRLQSMLSAKLAEEEGLEDEAPEIEAEPVAAEEPAVEEDYAEEPAVEELAVAEGEHEDMEEDLELEAIIKELESEMNEAEEPELEEVSGSTGIGKGTGMKAASSSDQDDPGKGKLKEEEEKEDVKEEKEDMDEDISIEEIINALREEDEKEDVDEAKEDKEEVDESQYTAGVDDGNASKLAEAYDVIRFLKGKINEVNLLNAKLLFSNKLFRNHSMNESQKMKVIENFDRATSIREVKLVFATLSEGFALTGKTKRTIKESYASKPSRSTAPNKEIISEGNDLTARWKKLANL
jgi:hypothetical protein